MLDFKNKLWSNLSLLGQNFEKILDIVIDGEVITKSQSILLFFIYDQKQTTINEISSKFHLNQGNTSSLCKKLEEIDYIKRIRNKEDERIVNVTLTNSGKEIVKKMHKKFKKIEIELKEVDNEKLESIIIGISNLNDLINKFISKEKGEKNVRN